MLYRDIHDVLRMEITMEKIIKSNARINEGNVSEFDKEITECIDDAECDTLVVDMSETVYVSSSCLRVLLKAFKSFRRKGGKFILRNVQPPIMEILEITGFAGNFTIE